MIFPQEFDYKTTSFFWVPIELKLVGSDGFLGEITSPGEIFSWCSVSLEELKVRSASHKIRWSLKVFRRSFSRSRCKIEDGLGRDELIEISSFFDICDESSWNWMGGLISRLLESEHLTVSFSSLFRASLIFSSISFSSFFTLSSSWIQKLTFSWSSATLTLSWNNNSWDSPSLAIEFEEFLGVWLYDKGEELPSWDNGILGLWSLIGCRGEKLLDCDCRIFRGEFASSGLVIFELFRKFESFAFFDEKLGEFSSEDGSRFWERWLWSSWVEEKFWGFNG